MIYIELKTAISSVFIIACIIICGYVLTQYTQNETVLDYNYTERCYDTKQVITHEIEYPCNIYHLVVLNNTFGYECYTYNATEDECKYNGGTLNKDNPMIKTINTIICTEWILIREDTDETIINRN